MKKFGISLAAALLAASLVACTPGTKPLDTGTSGVTDTQTPVVTVPGVDLSLKAASLEDGILHLELSAAGEATEGTLVPLVDGTETLQTSASFTDGGVYAMDLPVAADCTVRVEARCDKGLLDSVEIAYVNGLPQLSADTVSVVTAALSDEQLANLVVIQGTYPAQITYAVEAYGIPSITLTDGPLGVGLQRDTVPYPSGPILAGTWDDALIQAVGVAMGNDAIAGSRSVIYGPAINIQRDPFCGRDFEYFSEDPLLTGYMALSYINGMQSTGTSACIKHFAAYSQETSRTDSNSVLTERALREIYLTGFELAVRHAQPWCLMSSYNKVNGVYSSINRDLLYNILRTEFGYEGMVISDLGASGDIVQQVLAMNDMQMQDNVSHIAQSTGELLEGLADGRLPRETLVSCVENVLTLVVKSYEFNHSGYVSDRLEITEHQELSAQAAADGMVLLKNEGALPFASGEVAVFGTASYKTLWAGAGSSRVGFHDVITVAQGLSEAEGLSVNEAVAELYKDCRGHNESLLNIDVDHDNPEDDTLEIVITPEQAAAAAASSDIAVITISRITAEGDDHEDRKGDYRLNDREVELMTLVTEAFHAAGKKVVVLINTGNPLEVASWRDSVDGILYIGLAGDRIGTAAASLFTGEVNPSGKLTSTWPMQYSDVPTAGNFAVRGDVNYVEDVYVGYRYYSTFGVEVAYPFGYGLSYTSYDYKDLKMAGDLNELTVNVTVTNTGSVAGREVAELYVTKPDGKNQQPLYALCGYAKTGMLAPGASETVTIKVTSEDLKTYLTDDSAWVLEAGEYVFSAAASVEDIRLTASLTLDSQILVQDVENECEPTAEIDVLTKASAGQ